MAGDGSGLRLVGRALDEALAGKPAPKVARPAGGRDEEPEFPLLPPGCPVKPLGKTGQICHFLDEQGQLVSLDPQKIGKNHIRNLFGTQSHLCDEYWPRIGDNGKPNGWKPEIAGDLLMRACAFEGVIDLQGQVRGRGAHRGRNGELVLHCGDAIYVGAADDRSDDGYVEPGRIDGFVYPTAAALPRPEAGPVDSVPAEHLLAMFRTWNWARPIVDPMLLLGFVGASMLSGALEWRPHAWMTGSSATGKSTLQKAMEKIFDGAALHTGNASEASLRQILKQQTLPVFFDELEATKDNRRGAQVIELARVASSGAVVLRGGQDHQGHEFIVRSCFLFSSILIPPMLAQDRNRLAILELQRFSQDATPPVVADRELRLAGRQLRKRLIDQWSRFEETLHAWRVALAEHGHGGRSQDQFGTLMACAHLLLYDCEPEKDLLHEWGKRLAVDTLAEKTADIADEDEAVKFLATSILQVRGGDEPWPISRHVLAALQPAADKARDRLENFGLRVGSVVDRGEGKLGFRDPLQGRPIYLAIANRHEGLTRIFAPTRWSDGVWGQAFRRVDSAIGRVKVRFAGTSEWATLIPIGAIVDMETKPES